MRHGHGICGVFGPDTNRTVGNEERAPTVIIKEAQ